MTECMKFLLLHSSAGSSSQLGGYGSGALQSMGSGSMSGGHRPPLQPQHSPHRDGRMLPPGHSGEAVACVITLRKDA